MSRMQAFRGAVFHMLDDPWRHGDVSKAYQYWEDGLLLVADGKIEAVGPAAALLPQLPEGLKPRSLHDVLIMPGLIDLHLHSPQISVVACYGEQLLEWLHHYILPAEAEFADPAVARRRAQVFLKELLRQGTTTVLNYCAVSKESVEALFSEAEGLNMRLAAGKVMMDRNTPAGIKSSTPEDDYRESRELIEKWHGRARLSYALSPRFGPGCSPADLQAAGRLRKEYPGVYLQTHLNENRQEIAWVRELFPERRSYLDVYDYYGLLGERTVLGHALHMTEEDFARVKETGSVLCPCPPSNFFLGSGLFQFERAREYGVRVALGTDMGAGNTFSMLRAMEEAYKMAQLQGFSLSPLAAFYLATLGGARALSLDDKIGNFEAGKEADFIIMDLRSTPFLQFRMEFAQTLLEKLFVQMMLADDRAILATYVGGKLVHRIAGFKEDAGG